ncbi:ATP-binding protein [Brevibacterium sp. R8603A2]|uniref:AAA family ATPase n=1 Tax=Brevibacterium sp. R8603A2 TaxID=2929779 RepID=UPI001FFAC81A|nr:ATP-binding protein [Brevibacterium sp. R8603A2]MCK1803368.1 ATP-binding protein [Brevibacterium sp. R8603A2]
MSVTIPPPPVPGASPSPFTPTFGVIPPALVGRQGEVNDFAYALDSGPGATGRATLITGQRGVGKSVLLHVFHEVAASRQWMTVHAQASPGFSTSLTEARLPELLARLDAADTVESSVVGFTLPFGAGGLTTRTESTNPLTPDFRHHLMRALEILAAHGTGLVLTLDEVHRSQLDELRRVTDAIAYAFSQEAPVAFVAAGLPQTITSLIDDEVSTYLRRAERVTLGNLSPENTRIALEAPITQAGKTITREALELAIGASGHYPFLIQLIGDHAWRAAGDEDVISVEHVEESVARARTAMHRQIHEPTVEGLTDQERSYVLAMAADDDRSRTAEVARRMGVTAKYGSVYRARLITRGVIEPAGRGWVRFTMPYTREYLLTR